VAEVDDADVILVQVRLPRDLVRLVDHWRIDQDLHRAAAFATLLREGLASEAGAGIDRG
jgi:hypothetical protein